MRSDFLQRPQRALVALDGNNALGAQCEEGAGKAAGTGTHLKNGRLLERSGRTGDPRREIEVEQKVLAE